MNRSNWLSASGVGLLSCIAFTAMAQEKELVPETLSVKQAVEAGPKVYVGKQKWDGSSSLEIYGADDLRNKGNMTAGDTAQFLISRDGKTAYTQSTYLSRYSHGDVAQVLTIYDASTLSIKKEIPLPGKAALAAAFDAMLEQSADGRFIYVQNATPATSVTIVDITTGQVAQEVPTPGCWGIYPTLAGHAFSTICGDGSFATFRLSPDGKTAERSAGKKIFDADKDPIFIASQRVGGDLAFISYHGNVYLLSDAGAVVTLKDSFSILTGGPEGWAPGGRDVLAYNSAHGVIFVPMHGEAKDGSHKKASQEIWAYDVKRRRLLYQSPAEGVASLSVTQGQMPVLYGLDEGNETVIRFAVDPEAKFAVKRTATGKNTGGAIWLMARD